MPQATYTVIGGVNWTVCWGVAPWCGEYYSYSESGQAPPVTVLPTAVPTLDGVSPSSGSGSVQTFTAQYSSPAGGTDITEAWLWLHTTTATSTYSCLVRYMAATHAMALQNDTATAWTSAPVGAGPPPQNSRCLLNTLSSSATVAGTTRTVSFNLLFQPAFAGPKNIYMWASTRGASAGWQDRGDWTVLCPATLTPTTTTVPAGSGHVMFWISTGESCQWTAVGRGRGRSAMPSRRIRHRVPAWPSPPLRGRW